MLRDPEIYPDPDAFKPERFFSSASPSSSSPNLSSSKHEPAPDPRQFVFGFGRRRCPGNHLVEESLWMVMALIVATFDVSKPMDGEVEVEVEFDNAVFRYVVLILAIV